MTWTAPEIVRADPPAVAGERRSLENWLDYHRATLLCKCQRLTGDQLAQRAAGPSSLSLHARHNGHADILREQIDGVTGD